MAERLANHFAVYTPVVDLFLQYINGDRTDDAKFILEVRIKNFVLVFYILKII